jgi:starch-binding outer membrane protein, SusD/RagB family
MKTNYKILLIALLCSFLITSCEDYLDVPLESDVTEADVFTTWKDFQGFVEPMYGMLIDQNRHALTVTGNIGGEIIGSGTMNWTSGYRAMRGTYDAWFGGNAGTGTMHSNFYCSSESNPIVGGSAGEWPSSWKGIRIANKAIASIDLFTGTDEQRDLLLGQSYFFRAYFHWILIRSWGGMPYIDKYITAEDSPAEFSKRLTFQETVEKIVLDLDMAASLLPNDWNETTTGQLTLGANIGRVTKGAALGIKARALLYAGSPLMEGFSGGNFEYNVSYMQRAAAAAWDCISWAQTTGKSTLTPWADYGKMFARNDGGVAWTNEVLLSRIQGNGGSGLFANRIARNYSPNRGVWGGGTNANIDCLNQTYADRFEMADGTVYKPGNMAEGGYDDDNTKRWVSRDPRFKQNILVDRDMAGIAASLRLQLWSFPTPGRDRAWGGGNAQRTPYVIKKWWPIGVNNVDRVFTNYYLHTPHLRLADVYLMYAEAVTVAYGPTGSAPGASYTALQAVNDVRNRAGMPNASADAPGYAHMVGDDAAASLPVFLELIRNERFVELCFEGHWRWDMARWYILHLDQSRQMWDLRFNQTWTTFNRVQIDYMVFENPKHYWMPIPRPQTQIFGDFPQNPGWN